MHAINLEEYSPVRRLPESESKPCEWELRSEHDDHSSTSIAQSERGGWLNPNNLPAIPRKEKCTQIEGRACHFLLPWHRAQRQSSYSRRHKHRIQLTMLFLDRVHHAFEIGHERHRWVLKRRSATCTRHSSRPTMNLNYLGFWKLKCFTGSHFLENKFDDRRFSTPRNQRSVSLSRSEVAQKCTQRTLSDPTSVIVVDRLHWLARRPRPPLHHHRLRVALAVHRSSSGHCKCKNCRNRLNRFVIDMERYVSTDRNGHCMDDVDDDDDDGDNHRRCLRYYYWQFRRQSGARNSYLKWTNGSVQTEDSRFSLSASAKGRNKWLVCHQSRLHSSIVLWFGLDDAYRRWQHRIVNMARQKTGKLDDSQLPFISQMEWSFKCLNISSGLSLSMSLLFSSFAITNTHTHTHNHHRHHNYHWRQEDKQDRMVLSHLALFLSLSLSFSRPSYHMAFFFSFSSQLFPCAPFAPFATLPGSFSPRGENETCRVVDDKREREKIELTSAG